MIYPSKLISIAFLSLILSQPNPPLQPENKHSYSDNSKNTSQATKKFNYGINGHPLDAPPSPYNKVSLEQQLKLVKDLGMNYYRFEVGISPTGNPTNPWRLNPLFLLAEQYEIKVLPMILLRGLNFSISPAENYKLGKIAGSGFAKKYGKYLDYYELGNEQENRILNKGAVGNKLTDYDLTKVKATAAFMKGMDEGIKAEDPGAKTMTAVGWLHYGFLHLLKDNGYYFDAVDYHWYSDMESNAKSRFYNINNIASKLESEFPGKPIWFTEINTKKGSLNSNGDQQLAYINDFANKVKNNPAVEAVFIYELFDEPHKEPNERDYGIISWPSSFPDWNFKTFGKQLQKNKPITSR